MNKLLAKIRSSSDTYLRRLFPEDPRKWTPEDERDFETALQVSRLKMQLIIHIPWPYDLSLKLKINYLHMHHSFTPLSQLPSIHSPETNITK